MRISDWSSDVCSSDLRFRPQAPVLQLDEHHRRILATTGKVEASYRENGFDIVFFLFAEIAGDLVDNNLGPLGGGTRRGLHLDIHDALVLVRQERGRNTGIQQRHDGDDHGIDGEASAAPAQNPADHPGIAMTAAVEVTVEPAEETALLVMRSEEHTSELQSLMRISYAVFCLKK